MHKHNTNNNFPIMFKHKFHLYNIRYYTDISLLWGKYTRMFVQRFPGIPEMLYFPTPKAEGNITSRGFPGTEGQTFCIFPEKQWNNCYVTFYSWKRLKNRSEILGATLHQQILGTSWITSLVPSSARHYFKRCSFDPENFSGQYNVCSACNERSI